MHTTSDHDTSTWPGASLLIWGTFGASTPEGRRYHRRCWLALGGLFVGLVIATRLPRAASDILSAILPGAMFGFSGPLDGFGFGTINGVAAEYVITVNDAGLGQWWAKWELEGNQSSYTVDIVGAEGVPGGSILSVTDLQVDTLYSATGYAPDSAIVPEPSALLLSFAGAAMLLRRRR